MRQGRQPDRLRFGVQHDKFRDELNGLRPDAALCRAAWAKEIAYFRSRGIWETKRANDARAKLGRHPIAVQGVETNEDEDSMLDMRRRQVAREIARLGKMPSLPRRRPCRCSGWSSARRLRGSKASAPDFSHAWTHNASKALKS